MSTTEAPYAVEAALRRHFEREGNSQLGLTIRALLGSDNSRLTYWDASLAIECFDVQRRYVAGDAERVCVEAADADPTLRACIGFEAVPGKEPAESAWLVSDAGELVDPQEGRRPVDGFLGVALKATEADLWTPDQPWAVAERLLHRVAV